MAVQGQTVPGKDSRLDSWKAIAEFFGRDVRSVQRWESERGLPIHRIPGAKGGGVFAYTEELKAWLHSKSESLVSSTAQSEVAAELNVLQEPAPASVPDVEASSGRSLVPPARSVKGVYAIGGLVVVAVAIAVFLAIADRSKLTTSKPVAPRPMLAVLPFTNLSGDPSQEYFGDGLTEELITDIGRLDPAELGVIARTSSMKYKQTNKDVAEIGRELGVDYILEGSVRREQGVARISAQLIQVKDQSHIWAQTYQENADHVLDVQRKVAAAVADKIRVRLLARTQPEDTGSASGLPEAFDNYLEGLYFANQRSVAGLSKGVAFFTRAIEIDPNYAAAYAGLAQCYTLLALDGLGNPGEMKTKASAAAARAVALDDSSSNAHVILAGTKVFFDWDWGAAKSHFERALALNPNNALAHHWYANLYLAPRGRLQEALAEMKVAQQLDPLSLIINTDLGYTYYLAGDDDRALAQFQKVLEMDPSFVPAHFDLSRLYLQRHMYDPAVKELALDLQFSGQGDQIPNLQRIYSQSGYGGVAQLVANSNGNFSQHHGTRTSMFAAAQAYVFLGDTEQALSSLESAYASREPGIIFLKSDPVWNPLRSNARFQAIERKAGLID